jgi:DNA-binding CsgD family transcriptional regulator
MVQKNETMKELKENIGEIQRKDNGGINRDLQKLKNMVDYSFNLDKDWEEFRLYFEEVHTGFFDTLKERYPDLTPNELRLAALVKLNLSIKETATIMGITPDSVKTARYRLRKKLDMETEENLTEYMMEVEKEIG